jgi:Caspase domain
MADQFEKRAAILIGVKDYANVPPLQFCGADAVGFANVLQQAMGFQPDDILQMIEGGEYPPTTGTIFHSIGNMKKVKKVGKDDLLIFFFSGHGMIGEDGKDYVLPPDATPYTLEHSAIKIEDIAAELKKTGCNNIVMFIDACRNLDEKSITSIGQEASDAVRRAGIVTFFSCDPKQKSYEIDSLKHGSFTHCIIEAIGKGQGSSVSALDAYLRKRVPEINRQYKKPEQDPYTVIEPASKGLLPIFFNPTDEPGPGIATIEEWITLLSELWRDAHISTELSNKAIQYLELNKGTASFERDQRTVLIKGVYEGTVVLSMFIHGWEAIERKTAKPKPKTSLGNL